ncbi:MAG: N-acetylglucosamine-6-phosphate deacetylase [Actinomycetota bacterium]|nr:N-acetylglucosamine-6-phosphate deacetylase [Actinomycetota bacterium]
MRFHITGGRGADGHPIEVAVDGDRIAASVGEAATLNAGGLLVVPGLIDLQLNGAFGSDFTDDPGSIWRVAARLPELGVTSFLPTLVSTTMERIDTARDVLARRPSDFIGAQPLGLHIEGPMISRERHGTHPLDRLVPAASSYDWSPSTGVALVTLAPELPGSIEATAELVERGVVVSLGHSDTTAEIASTAADAGARFGTHLFNAMSSITSREPGLAGFLMTDERMRFGMIIDGLHLADRVVRLARAVAGDRIVLVTDAMAAVGVGDGTYSLADITVHVHGLEARNDIGGLAGSVLTMPLAVRTFREITGCPLTEAVDAATERPAAVVGASDRGSLRVGGRADVTLLDERFDVAATVVGGQVAFLRDPERLEKA